MIRNKIALRISIKNKEILKSRLRLAVGIEVGMWLGLRSVEYCKNWVGEGFGLG